MDLVPIASRCWGYPLFPIFTFILFPYTNIEFSVSTFQCGSCAMNRRKISVKLMCHNYLQFFETNNHDITVHDSLSQKFVYLSQNLVSFSNIYLPMWKPCIEMDFVAFLIEGTCALFFAIIY